MRKLLKMIVYLSLAIIVVYCYYIYETKDAVWVEFNDGKIRAQIHLPDELAESKDCNKFFEWQDTFFPKDVHVKCPWVQEREK